MDVESGKSTGWDVETLKIYMEAMRTAEDKFQAERDRRYTEVVSEREKALKIKEEADKEALRLQRDNQTYKDEKANMLREQIGQERGQYASKEDLSAAVKEIMATMRPLAEYVGSQRGPRALTSGAVMGAVAGAALILGLAGTIVALLMRSPRP